MIRICTIEDSEWLIDLAVECYSQFDVESTFPEWLTPMWGRSDVVIVRGEESAALAYISHPFWQKDFDCELQFICSKKTRFGAIELLHCVKYINELRKNAGCARLYINSRLADLEPIALRVGAKLAGKSYVLED